MANPTGRGGLNKGKSGNPGGRPRQLASVMHEARRHTFEAIRTLLTLMRTAESESVRLNAAESILNRGRGRPIQALQVDGRFVTKKLTDLTADEIKALDARVEMWRERETWWINREREGQKLNSLARGSKFKNRSRWRVDSGSSRLNLAACRGGTWVGRAPVGQPAIEGQQR